MEQWIDTVFRELPKLKIMEEEPMKKHTTFRVGGPARALVEPGSAEDVKSVVELVRKKNLNLWLTINHRRYSMITTKLEIA